jgi:hypothetical protein
MNEDNEFFKQAKPSSSPAMRNMVISFLCGLLGSAIIFLVVLGVPGIRDNIFNEGENSNEETKETASGTYNIGNLEQVSLKNYSDTAIYSANKVLPSIVGISVEYSVTSNSRFQGIGGGQSTATAEGSRNYNK